MSDLKTTVIVVNWNAGSQLRNCIDSITKNCSDLVECSIVIDNGSIDESADSIKNLEKVHLIRAGENLGFGKACNLGAQHAQSEFLLFLNPDAALHANTLQRALAFLNDQPNQKVGICGVQLLDETGHIAHSCTRFPSVAGFVAHSIGLDRFIPRLGHFMAEWNHAETRIVDHVIGAFFLVRREMFVELNGFDERFFVYLEDLDFSYRAKKAGWSSVYLADAQAFHAGGGTSNQVKAKRLFYSLRSRLLYSFKHFSFVGALSVLLSTLVIEPISRSAMCMLRGSWTGLKETWAAYGMLWRWLPQWISKGVTR